MIFEVRFSGNVNVNFPSIDRLIDFVKEQSTDQKQLDALAGQINSQISAPLAKSQEAMSQAIATTFPTK